MANITVSFNNKKTKERELKEWLEQDGGPIATVIKDKLYEYKQLQELFKVLKDISKVVGSADQLPDLLSMVNQSLDSPQPKKKESPKKERTIERKVKKRSMPDDFIL